MTFGSWTYDGSEVDLVHLHSQKSLNTIKRGMNVCLVPDGIDVDQFYPSDEWDIMAIPSVRKLSITPLARYTHYKHTLYNEMQFDRTCTYFLTFCTSAMLGRKRNYWGPFVKNDKRNIIFAKNAVIGLL